MEGIVLKSTGSFYQVASLNGEGIFLCRIKGKMRTLGKETTNPVTVGDHVVFEVGSNPGEGLIAEVLQRRNYIIRKSVKLSKQAQVIAANIDLALVVATPVLPRTSTGFIDRFLATAEAYNIPGGIVFNKSDLYDDEINAYVDELTSIYKEAGYQVFLVSARNAGTLTTLRNALVGKVVLFSGHSGTGKSTLINQLIPGLNLKTTAISIQHLKGKHTTTFAEMHPLPEGGYIIDTPGIREFGVLEFDRYEISHFFPEIFRASSGCKFNNCLHLNEKDCAVINAVEEGKIAQSRYAGYISILNNEDLYN